MGTGRPPDRWAMLMVELMAEDYDRSLAFWTGPLGFRVAYTRPAMRFAYLERPEGGQMMIYERDGDWETGPMEPPFGRGASSRPGSRRCAASAGSSPSRLFSATAR